MVVHVVVPRFAGEGPPGREVQDNEKAAVTIVVPRPLEPPFPGGPGSSCRTRRQSPRARASRQGRQSFFFDSVGEDAAVHMRNHTHILDFMQPFLPACGCPVRGGTHRRCLRTSGPGCPARSTTCRARWPSAIGRGRRRRRDGLWARALVVVAAVIADAAPCRRDSLGPAPGSAPPPPRSRRGPTAAGRGASRREPELRRPAPGQSRPGAGEVVGAGRLTGPVRSPLAGRAPSPGYRWPSPRARHAAIRAVAVGRARRRRQAVPRRDRPRDVLRGPRRRGPRMAVMRRGSARRRRRSAGSASLEPYFAAARQEAPVGRRCRSS